jgi:hypothetical protein
MPNNPKTAVAFLMSMTEIPPRVDAANFVASGDHAIETLIRFAHRERSATRCVRLLLMSVT